LVFQISSTRPAASAPYSSRSALKTGCFSEKTKVAVSDAEKPWVLRDREMSASPSRTPLHAVERAYAHSVAQEAEELAGLVPHLAVRDHAAAREGAGELGLDPLVEDMGLAPLEKLGQTAVRHGCHWNASGWAARECNQQGGHVRRTGTRPDVVRTYGSAGGEATRLDHAPGLIREEHMPRLA
jgi:hypothetical protein